MATLKGVIRDSVSGASVEAKVHVLTSSGNFVHPANSILKIGPGDPFFYCPGEFTVDVPRGSTDIVVERGTEYEPLRKVVSMPAKGRSRSSCISNGGRISRRRGGIRAIHICTTMRKRLDPMIGYVSIPKSTISA